VKTEDPGLGKLEGKLVLFAEVIWQKSNPYEIEKDANGK